MRFAGFTKGMLMGLAVGAAVGMAFDPITDGNRKKMKKNAERFMYTVKDMGK